jgi:hypothetical protein
LKLTRNDGDHWRGIETISNTVLPSGTTVAARGEMTAAAAFHLLHGPRCAKTHGHFDDAKVMETQEAEQAAKEVHHFAAWHGWPIPTAGEDERSASKEGSQRSCLPMPSSSFWT